MNPDSESDAAAHLELFPSGHSTAASANTVLPEATVRRLTSYLRALDLVNEEQTTVSSQGLAEAAGTNSATLRKDLSLMGTYGRRGVGYDVKLLRELLENTLGLNREWRVMLVGAGNLGRALAGYAGFSSHGFRFVGVVDNNPDLVGMKIHDLDVSSSDKISAIVTEHRANLAVVTVPGAAAQHVVDELVEAGVRNILSFAPVRVTVPAGVTVRRVDVAREIQMLAYFAVAGGGMDK
ncbi:redox-sensing transcriptional repressor Rex [Neomicrococcus lactis]|uniref:Redox-sensing transcriptional repressor Rex n=1 Tax=Neomicrococcus lactis TaxID=732241 RepID=A0A7W9D9Z4_9MICC|nr:redox-sensing transcriptional repressor Rex [Neomicrococcus lactis]MBB5596929.1 redox-sensing transcriptional repressor [Neomicrococcus lactis]